MTTAVAKEHYSLMRWTLEPTSSIQELWDHFLEQNTLLEHASDGCQAAGEELCNKADQGIE